MEEMGKAWRGRYLFIIVLAGMLALVFITLAQAQDVHDQPLVGRVDIQPSSPDDAIATRLTNILQATGWFTNAAVEVRDGVVFLRGQTLREEHQRWAGELARRTENAVAVVNEIDLSPGAWWEFEPALESLRALWRDILSAAPTIVFGLVILILTWMTGKFASRGARASFGRHLKSPLLCTVAGRAVHTVVVLIGIYLILQIAGLTNVAFTIVGGTGLLGLILGIAFRDITENFLASMFLAVQQPFRNGDLIEIAGILGLVQRLTARSTTLMTLDGNHVQIPNATVYKSVIRNFTSNPNRREDFVVGIGFDDTISHAQEIALAVLREHPAVLQEPEPWVLVDKLGKATVNLRVYFWIDGGLHSWLKVRSSVIRLVKRAFQSAGISMPDEAREIVFPKGVPLELHGDSGAQSFTPAPAPDKSRESGLKSEPAEGGLSAETATVEEQARSSRVPEQGRNLLADSH